MKLNKLVKAAATLLVAATVLAACKFEGTKANFKDEVQDGYKVGYYSDEVIEKPGMIIDGTTSISKAEEKTRFNVSVVSQGDLNEKSIESAMNLYLLSDNTDDNFAPVRDTTPLNKKILKIDTTYYTTGSSSYNNINSYTSAWYGNNDCVVTKIEFEADTSSVTKAYIAFVADATKLKEKTGNLILNGNGNYKCGEESDSYITPIYVAKKSDGTTNTEALKNSASAENFHPKFSLSDPSFIEDEVDSEGKKTGVRVYRITASSLSKASDPSNPIYADSFEAELNKMYSFRTLPMGAKKWTETAFDFKWDSEHHYYEAKTAALEYGTKYCIGIKAKNELKWEAAKDWYGHVPVLGYGKNKNSYGGISTWTYMKEAPEYIYTTPNNGPLGSAGTWTANTTALDTFDAAQTAILDVEERTGAIIVSIDLPDSNEIFFATYDGFVVTDNKLNVIKTKKPVVWETNDDGKVNAILIEFENKNLDWYDSNSNPLMQLWVNDKTTIEGNKVYTNQVKFGRPGIEATDHLTGYALVATF